MSMTGGHESRGDTATPLPVDPMSAVNAQHMRTMGLDPTTLGKPYEEVKGHVQSVRCDSWEGPNRCARPAGHDGVHAKGQLRWLGEGETPNSAEVGVDEETLLSALDWAAADGIRIHDASGWRNSLVRKGVRYPSRPLTDPITYEEYQVRLATSEVASSSDPDGDPTGDMSHWATKPTRAPGNREGDQVLPTGDESIEDDQTLIANSLHQLAEDVLERRRLGIQRYGQGHRPFNGRNTIQDAYDEGVDQTVYLGSLLRARIAKREDLIPIVESVLLGSDIARPELADRIVDRVLDYVTIKIEEARNVER